VAAHGGRAAERGQGTVEWIGLVLLVSLALVGALAVAGVRAPTGLAAAIYSRMVCALDVAGPCSGDPELVVAYDPDVAAAVRDHAPQIRYEDGMTALPVDFRSCRDAGCGNGPDAGAVSSSDTGEPAAAFVHVIDCRADAAALAESRGYDCSGGREGNLYVQYWLYYEDSTTAPALPGDVGHHQDDWEGYQVRIGPDGVDARATSHNGYNYDGGAGSWASDIGISQRSAWGSETGHLYVAGGSHAGHVHEDWDRLRRSRWTPADHLWLIPIETLDPAARRTPFAVIPPWRKPVYRDPEG
jgi:hypothetical protein